MKKIILVLSIIFTIFPRCLHGQTVQVPLKHWIYDFIERMEIRGISRQITTQSYPLTRSEIAMILAEIDSKADILSSVELAQFEQLKGEFGEELATSGIRSNPRWKERHLMTWHEDESHAKVDFDFGQKFDVRRGDQYRETERISQTTMGGIIRGALGKYLNFYIHAQNRLDRGTDITEERFDPQYGTPRTISGKNVYTDETWAYLLWRQSWFQAEFGRDQLKWGPGRRGSLMLSRENLPFEMLKLKFSFKRFQFTSFHGSLHAGDVKYIAGHRLELMLFPWWYVSGSEVVIYGHRDIEAAYLNPLMPYHVAEHHLGDKDNNTMGLDMTIYPLRSHQLYLEFFLDDFTTAENPFTYYGNKFAFLIGHRWVNPLGLENTGLSWEYTRIEPYVYTHQDSINIYVNYDQPIGHWLGPNADDLYIELSYKPYRDLDLQLSAERVRRGKGDINTPHQSSEGKRKKFLSGIVESTWSYGLQVSDQIFKDVFISMKYFVLRTNYINKLGGVPSNDQQASIELMVNW